MADAHSDYTAVGRARVGAGQAACLPRHPPAGCTVLRDPTCPPARQLYRSLENRKGEFQIDSMNSVEDTKGNNGERGELMITNLRMVWYSSRSRKTNLSKR